MVTPEQIAGLMYDDAFEYQGYNIDNIAKLIEEDLTDEEADKLLKQANFEDPNLLGKQEEEEVEKTTELAKEQPTAPATPEQSQPIKTQVTQELKKEYPEVKHTLQAAHKKFFEYYNTAKKATQQELPNRNDILDNIYDIQQDYKKIAGAYPTIHPTVAGKVNQPAPEVPETKPEQTKPEAKTETPNQEIQSEPEEQPESGSPLDRLTQAVRDRKLPQPKAPKPVIKPPVAKPPVVKPPVVTPKRTNNIINKLNNLAKDKEKWPRFAKFAQRAPKLIRWIRAEALKNSLLTGQNDELINYFQSVAGKDKNPLDFKKLTIKQQQEIINGFISHKKSGKV